MATNKNRYTMPMILPLDLDGQIYVVQDQYGTVVGTGSREVCEVLIKFLLRPCAAPRVDDKYVDRNSLRDPYNPLVKVAKNSSTK